MSFTPTELSYMRDQKPYTCKIRWCLAIAPYGTTPIFTARVNDPGGTIDDPNMTIPIDAAVNNGVEDDMTLWVGSSALARDVGKVRIRDVSGIGAGSIEVAENDDIEWADDLYLTEPGDAGFRELWSKYQRLDAAGALYKDYDIAYGAAGNE